MCFTGEGAQVVEVLGAAVGRSIEKMTLLEGKTLSAVERRLLLEMQLVGQWEM